MNCDVFVAGGGSAGLAAAVAAARAGARTILAERSPLLGGMASLALVHSICGLYLLREENGARLANLGFPAEFSGRLLKCGGAKSPVRLGKVDVLFHDPKAFARLAGEIANHEPLLEIRLNTEIVGAKFFENDTPLTAISIRDEKGVETIDAKAVVDASGDAVLANFCGLPCEESETDRLQRPAFIFALKKIDTTALTSELRLKIAHRMAAAVRDGKLPKAALGAGLRAGVANDEVFVTIDLEPPDGTKLEPLNRDFLSKLATHGHKIAMAVSGFLRAEFAEFAVSEISRIPQQIGVRESRRVVGEYQMTADDLLNSAKFSDAIALATWPMELRERATGARLRFPKSNLPCEIPLRSLRAKNRANFFVAGRDISATHEAHASLRVIGTCFATGESAGLAASLVARNEPLTASAVNALKTKVMLPIAQNFLTNEHC